MQVASATQPERFCDNSVTNSKYTLLNFVPRALWEQFQRLANVYFLLMVRTSATVYIDPNLGHEGARGEEEE